MCFTSSSPGEGWEASAVIRAPGDARGGHRSSHGRPWPSFWCSEGDIGYSPSSYKPLEPGVWGSLKGDCVGFL